MTGVADPALDLARYVSAISGGDPNSVGKMPDQKVLDMALANLDKIFGQGPEKAADAEGVLNVVCFLFQRVVESITASEAAKLAETVTSKLAADTECAPIRLKTMASIYNICRGNGGARFKTFMAMVSYASAAGKAEFASVFPSSDKLDALLSEWGTDESNTREVYSVLMAAAEKHGNSDDLHALRLKVLATFQGKPASADALQQASKAVSEVLGNPLIFQFDTYMQLDAIQALKSDAAHAPVYALLELFCTEDLGAYNAFCNKNAAAGLPTITELDSSATFSRAKHLEATAASTLIYTLSVASMRAMTKAARHWKPVVPIPPSTNGSTRMLLSMGLQEAVRRSIEAHPPPAGSTGPNHFMIVARVCSCFISAARRPHLGGRARDECQPFPRSARPGPDLSQSVRVLSYEQVTPLDRRWSTSPSVPPRLANLVVPYPSSLLGADVPKGRKAPWEGGLALAKPVRVFSAFGMISNMSSLTAAQLVHSFATHCDKSEQRMIGASSCYGKRCRFALRALVLSQLDAARVPLHERHRERSCLREGRACPAVMSLSFWAPHDGGDGYGKLMTHAHGKPKDEPLYVDDREANDVLAVYRVMLSSTFCVHIGGDTPTRKSFIDAIMAVCIPVVFHNASVLFDSLPYRDAIPYERMVLHVPLMAELTALHASRATPTATAAASGDGGASEPEGEGGGRRLGGKVQRKADSAERKARLHSAGATSSAPTLADGAEAGDPAEAAPANHAGDLMAHLHAVPASVIRSKQALLREYAPLLQYPYPKLHEPKQRGASQANAAAGGPPNAVTLAIDRLAADIAVPA